MQAHRIALPVLGSLLLTACGGDAPVDPNALQCTIPADELFAAATRDAIPSLTTPEVAQADASFMEDTDRVLGVVVNGEARAYPFGILWWHEIVNDFLGGEDILVTYCPLTGSGIAFDPHVGGQLRTFQVSGLLWRTNLTMIDRESESLWNQMLLGSPCGVDRGTALTRIPIVEADWGVWKAQYPNTTVVTPNTGFGGRPYFSYPYGDYADPDNPFVDFLPPDVTWGTELKTKELVLGVFDGTTATAYSLERLADGGDAVVANDMVGSIPVAVTYRAEGNVAVAFDRRVGGQTLSFDVTSAAPFTMVDAETGSEWNALGEATTGALAGTQLEPIEDSFVAFWFAWSVYYPTIEIFAF
jgi:hypothetical protein